MLNLGIFFGGKSVEHEISILSCKNIVDALDRSKYKPVLIFISKAGEWHLVEEGFLSSGQVTDKANTNTKPTSTQSSTQTPETANNPVCLVPGGKGQLILSDGKIIKVNVAFPILHGYLGEDGAIQGLFKIADVPFIGSDVIGSAIGMDKAIAKNLLEQSGIRTAKWIDVRSELTPPNYIEIITKIGVPFFVKPASSGSSVGVHKVHNAQEYELYLKDALKYDHKILLEECINGREIECAVLGNISSDEVSANDMSAGNIGKNNITLDNINSDSHLVNPDHKIIAAEPGEVIANSSNHEFYSYEAKYLDENGAALQVPAKLDTKTANKIKAIAVRAFTALELVGMARVDFFLQNNGEVILNEVNTIPGFTNISMYPRLWQNAGLSYTELISRLIELGIAKYERDTRLVRDWEA